MRNRIVMTSGALALALTLAACGGGETGGDNGSDGNGGTENGGEGGTLTVGIKFDQPGLGLQVGSEYEGFDVAVAEYVAEHLGYEDVEFVESISANRETMLENGQVDMIFATYSITEARQERVDFAGPYFVAGQDLLVRADDTTITGPEALDGKNLCSVEGSTSAERIRDEHAEGVQLFPAPTYSECVELLSSGQVDAVTTDDIILAGFANQEAYTGKFTVVGNTFSEENYGVGLPDGSSETCEKVNEAILAMIEDGSWEAALTEHAGEDYQYNAESNPPEMMPCE